MTQSKDLDTSYRIAFPEDVARRMGLASRRKRDEIAQAAAQPRVAPSFILIPPAWGKTEVAMELATP